ncbi:MAG: MBL fold metallo-hydrolase [Candidatus Omnitrophica bacterium]|nr:MBL fold metallo-hydrolase [Candidatus Omnitrophota bacterium]
MKVKILFDKDNKNKKLHVGWGVSFLVDGKILFDTGENGFWLLENMRILNADSASIEAVVISHDHWDHTGGLWELLRKKEGLLVYGCPNFSLEFKEKVKRLKGKLIEAKKVTEIAKDIFVSGEIEGKYKGEYMPEEALVVKTDKGVSIITGCAHPGIVKILKTVKGNFPKESIYTVLGGFHLVDKDKREVELIVDEFIRLGVEKTAPTHCSGYEAQEIFKNKYRKDFISVNVGEIIEV